VRAVRYAVGSQNDQPDAGGDTAPIDTPATVGIDQHALDVLHLRDPRTGDYWRRNSQPVLVVIGVMPDAVLVCRTKIHTDGVWQWNVAVVTPVPRETWLESLADCHVTPEYDRFTRDAAIRAVFGDAE
jgi:hypothetical protein